MRQTKPNEAGQPVAMKFINLATCSENYKKRFFPREIQALRTLKNPHLVPVHEIIVDKKVRYFVVMELCKEDLLKEGRSGPTFRRMSAESGADK